MKCLVALSLCLAVAAAFSTCGKKGPSSRIINGVDAGQGEFPWQISLRWSPFIMFERQHICGGTLIAPNWVLCASHCFMQDKTAENFRVRIGEWHQQEDDGTEQDFTVERIITHEQFNTPHNVEHDVALIKLAEPVDFTGPWAGPACLPDEDDDYRGAEGCWLSGWGLTLTSPPIQANTLQKLKGTIWADADLKARWPGMIWPGMMGFGTDMTSACMGDSGGPLVCPSKSKPGQYDVVGVVSWGKGDCSGQPGIFTEVSHFLPWIEDHMQ